MDEAPEQELQEKEPVDVVSKVQAVGAGLSELAGLLDAGPDTSDDDRAQMAQIISMFSDLVEKKLGGGPQPADGGMVSAMGGEKGVPMGPQGKM